VDDFVLVALFLVNSLPDPCHSTATVLPLALGILLYIPYHDDKWPTSVCDGTGLAFSNFDSEEPLRVRPLVGCEVRERGRLWSSCKLSIAVWLEGIKRSRNELWSTVKLGSDVE
jgi:hypothetical protein